MIPYHSKLHYFLFTSIQFLTGFVDTTFFCPFFQCGFQWNCRTVVSHFYCCSTAGKIGLHILASATIQSVTAVCVCVLCPQPRQCYQGIPEGHDSCNPDCLCPGSLPARPAGGVHCSPWLPLEASGKWKWNLSSSSQNIWTALKLWNSYSALLCIVNINMINYY